MSKKSKESFQHNKDQVSERKVLLDLTKGFRI